MARLIQKFVFTMAGLFLTIGNLGFRIACIAVYLRVQAFRVMRRGCIDGRDIDGETSNALDGMSKAVSILGSWQRASLRMGRNAYDDNAISFIDRQDASVYLCRRCKHKIRNVVSPKRCASFMMRSRCCSWEVWPSQSARLMRFSHRKAQHAVQDDY